MPKLAHCCTPDFDMKPDGLGGRKRLVSPRWRGGQVHIQLPALARCKGRQRSIPLIQATPEPGAIVQGAVDPQVKAQQLTAAQQTGGGTAQAPI